jgi:hypothetical protein
MSCIRSVSKYWERSGMGDLMYFNTGKARKESKYELSFIHIRFKDIEWAFKIYEAITLENARKPKPEK